jgi:hypothetical protein
MSLLRSEGAEPLLSVRKKRLGGFTTDITSSKIKKR